uniref:MFS domain-containing protein n=1 Tax=Trichuris muris TaxID=70415 RepID=A0A5S6QZI9_TRIMR
MEGMVEAGEYPKRKISAFMYAATVFSSLGSFLFGFHTGGISSAIPLIKYRIGIDHVWQESIVSITIGAAAVSSLVGGTISDCFGRKFTMRCSSMFFLLGSIVFIAANEKITLLVSRTLLGFATGFACASVPLYIAECSPTHSRGVLLSLNSVFITGGNFISNFLCAAFSSYVDNGWRIAFAFSCLPPAAQLFAFCYLPESPLWYIEHGRFYDAHEALRKLRPNSIEATREFELLKAKNEQDELEFLSKAGKPTMWSMLRNSKLLGLCLVGWCLFAFQQICGINVVLYYSATIIQMAGVNTVNISLWLAAASSGIYLLCTVLSMPLVERFKRRVLILSSSLMVFISLLVIATGFHFVSATSLPVTTYETWDKSETCSLLTTCDACVSSSRCGFCYTEQGHSSSFVNGSCAPRMRETNEYAAIGRCSSLLKNRGNFIWAPEWCPSSYAWIPVVGLLFYVLSFAPGLGIMPWIINAELYPQCLRSAGISMATTANFVFNLIVTLPFLTVVDYFGKAGTFYFLAIASLAAFLCFFLFLPETSGKHILSQFVPSWPAYENDKKHFGRRSSFSDSANFRYMRIRGHNQQFYNEDEMSE